MYFEPAITLSEESCVVHSTNRGPYVAFLSAIF